MKTLFQKSIALICLFTIFSCSKDSPTNQTSPCPQGFTGANCTTKITPSKIKITSIDITNYPVVDYNNGNIAWDANEVGNASRPDMFFALYQNSNYVYVHNYVFNDSDPSLAHTFTLINPITITSINAPIILELRDFNQSNNTYDIMGNTLPSFIYNASDLTFPSTITLSNTNQFISVVLHLSYEW
jgi:hypothetical protein